MDRTYNLTTNDTTRLDALKEIRRRTGELARHPKEEGFHFAPSAKAMQEFSDIVAAAYLGLIGNVVVPLIASDGNGGLKFDWRKSFDAEVRLYLSGINGRQSYLYYKIDGDEEVIYDPNREVLAKYLNRLV